MSAWFARWRSGAAAQLARGGAAWRSALQWWCRQPHHVPAAILLVATWVVFYAWGLVPPELQADTWNMGSSLGRIILLALVVLAYRSPPVTAAAVWWCFEDVQVVACGVLWMFAPWPVDTGSRCSDRFGIPLNLVGMSLAAASAWVLLRDVLRGGRP